MSGVSISWSNVESNLVEFMAKNPLPQVVKVKKSAVFKSSTELILHESKPLRKVEACIVSEGKSFVLPYDCPAKVYQLTKAKEYETLGELRKSHSTCRFFVVTSKPVDQSIQELERGEVLTIIFKKLEGDSDVFTCERKKLGVKVKINSNAKGGFSPMATVAERKINDFIRQYSTFPVGIALSDSALASNAFSHLSQAISQSKSSLIELKKLFTVDTILATSLGKKKSVYIIPKELSLTVNSPKALLSQDNAQHVEFCKKLHEDMDKSSIETQLSLAVTFKNCEKDILQWSYGDEGDYEVVPITAGKTNTSKDNAGLLKRDGKDQAGKISNSESEMKEKESKEKLKESKAKGDEAKETITVKEQKKKEKTKEKEKPKQKVGFSTKANPQSLEV